MANKNHLGNRLQIGAQLLGELRSPYDSTNVAMVAYDGNRSNGNPNNSYCVRPALPCFPQRKESEKLSRRYRQSVRKVKESVSLLRPFLSKRAAVKKLAERQTQDKPAFAAAEEVSPPIILLIRVPRQNRRGTLSGGTDCK